MSQHPLLSGRMCLESCDARCCYETEMILTRNDVKRITQHLGLSLENFAFMNDDGFYQLKNKNGYCIFLDESTKQCSIHDIKPSGCKVYPIIFDVDQNQCVLDDACPFTSLITASDLASSCHRTKKVAKELLSDMVGR